MRIILYFIILFGTIECLAQRPRALGIDIGVLPTGENNSITDVADVTVGHRSVIKGENIRTGVTAILPHQENLFQRKVPAAIYIHNGFGKLSGISQVQELGLLETPIILTNTLSVPTAAEAVIDYTLTLPGNEEVRSVNPVIGETNDGRLNDIRKRSVEKGHVLDAISTAKSGAVQEGNVGAGTGTVCFGYKGGIGTSSRVLPEELGDYTVGVLVQSNFGGVLEIAGVPIGKELERYPFKEAIRNADGSCMIIIITDAPLDHRNLYRLAKRASMGLAKTGGIASNGSGDYVIAVSNAESVRVPYEMYSRELMTRSVHNDAMSPIFMAAIEATEEAIINSLFAAQAMTSNGVTVEELPKEEVLTIMRRYGRIDER